MSAIVAVHKENSLVVATDSRLRLTVGRNGERTTESIDGTRKLVPVGEDRVLVQGSKGGLFRPEEHPGLMRELEGLDVEATARRLAEWSGEDRTLYLYVAGIDPRNHVPTLAAVSAESVQVQRQTCGIATVGMDMLIKRLHNPVMYPPDGAHRSVSPEELVDAPVMIDPSTLSVGEALDCAVFLLRTAGKYSEFLSGDSGKRAAQEAEVPLDEDGRGVRTIGGPIQAAVFLRAEAQVARSFYTFGDSHKTELTIQ